MKIYIKPYLRNLPIVDQMCNLIIEYSKVYESGADVQDDYEGYQEWLSNDPVKRFLEYMFPETYEFKDGQDRRTVVNYLMNLFYETKGTYKVLDYLVEYDIFHTPCSVAYTTQAITLDIEYLSDDYDQELFCNYLEEFLCSLLYFQILNINIGGLGIKVENKTATSLNRGSHFYKHYILEEEQENGG